jgi:hypothetical protein
VNAERRRWTRRRSPAATDPGGASPRNCPRHLRG